METKKSEMRVWGCDARGNTFSCPINNEKVFGLGFVSNKELCPDGLLATMVDQTLESVRKFLFDQKDNNELKGKRVAIEIRIGEAV